MPVGAFATHGSCQGLDVELVHWTWAEPEAPLEKPSTFLRGKSDPGVSNIHQTSQGKGKSRLGHSSSSPHSQDRLVRRTPSLAQSTAPELLQQDLGLMGPGCFQVMMPTVGLGCAPSTGNLLSCRETAPHKESSSVFIVALAQPCDR